MPDRVRANYKRTAFPGRGPCSKTKDVVHQYTMYNKKNGNPAMGHGSGVGVGLASATDLNMGMGTAKPGHPPHVIDGPVVIKDIINNSCLNGWTCGNIAAAPMDIARFHWDLHHGNIVGKDSLAQVQGSH